MKKLFFIIISALCFMIVLSGLTLNSTNTTASTIPKPILYQNVKIQILKNHQLDHAYLKSHIMDTLYYLNLNNNKTFMTELLLGTAAVETDFGKYNDIHNNVDYGVFQINIHNFKDMFKNFLDHRPELRDKVINLMWSGVPISEQLLINLKLQIALAAIHYYRMVPHMHKYKVIDMGWLWKRFYNTYLGAGETKHFLIKYKLYCSL